MPDSPHEIRRGRRVVCTANGPHKGARGRVREILNGNLAVVEFESTTILEPTTFFEPV